MAAHERNRVKKSDVPKKQHTVQTKLTSLLPLSHCTYLHACSAHACCIEHDVGMYFTRPAFKPTEHCCTKNLVFSIREPDDATPPNRASIYQ